MRDRLKKEKTPLSAAQLRKRTAKRSAYLRAMIQLGFFVLTPAMFATAFSGVKNIFTRIGAGQVLEFNGFVLALVALCGYTIVFGRFFCGYACAFGSLGDLLHWLGQLVQKKCKKKLPRLPAKLRRALSYLPYLILTVIMALCAAGIYGRLSGWSPWDVFSMLTAGRLGMRGYLTGVLLLVLILIGMVLESRFFCRFLCPMGAVFRLLPILPLSVLQRDRTQCLKGCAACERSCPVETRLSVGENDGDCIRCGKCMHICPKDNVGYGISRPSGKALWPPLIKAALLLGLGVLMGAVRFL